MPKEKIMELLDEMRYELADGIGLPGYARKFSNDEWETIHAVMRYVTQKFEKELK